MILLLRVRNQYVAILAQTTESFRRLSVTVSEHFTPDRAVPAITRILSHGTPSARTTALDLAEQYDIPVPVPALIEQCVFEPLQSGSRATALWLMARDGNADQAPEPLTAQTDPQVSETWLIVRLARGEVLTDAEQQQLIRAPDSRTILRLLALLSAAHERVQPAAARWLLPRALDAAADLLSHNPPPPVVRFRQILQLIGAAYAVDQAEQQVRNLRLGGSAAKSARCFLQRLCEIAIETEALRAQLAEDPRWVDLLHGLLPFDIGIARLALALLLCTPSALNDSGPLLASPDLAAIIQQTWQSVATPAAVRSRLQAIPEDPIVCEWLSRPHPKEAPPAAMAVTMRRMTEIWLGECELLASVYVQTPLLQRTLEECILRRLALLVRMVGWQSGHKSLSILAVPATLQSRSRRTNVAELVDQLWDHPSKNRLIKMLEREFLSHPIADLNAQSVSWDRLPFSTTESRIRSIGCLQLGIDCEPMEDPVNIVEKVLALSSVDLFTHLPIQELERIAEIAETISYNAEDSIIVDGTEGNSLYLLTDGTVEVRKHGKHLATLKGGVCFGEMSLLDDQPRSADVVATTPVSCLHIDRDEFAILLLDQPVISRSIMTVLTGRLRAANEQTRS